MLLTLLSLAMVSVTSFFQPVPASVSGKYFDHIVTILMENNDLQSVLSQGTFQASLGNQYTLSTGYSAVSHPSEPNYSALISGHISPNSDDGICCGQDSGTSIVDSMESHGLTWKAFAEGLSNGDCMGSGIDTDHFPFLYFSDIVSNPSRCANLLGAAAKNDPELLSTLNAASGWPNFIWLTPNTKDDSHDTTIAFGDSYLAGVVPKILSSNLFSTQRAALFIVYDEGNDVSCSSGGNDCVYASWSGSVAKKAFTSASSYTHYSYLHTIEDNWALPTLSSNDNSAPVMSEFFATTGTSPLSTSFTTLPSAPQVGQPVTFTASTSGGTSPYSDSWNFGDGSSGIGSIVSHTFSTTGTFQVTLTTRDSTSPANTAISTRALTVSPAASPLTITFSFSPRSPTVGQTINFAATVSGGTQPYGVGWDFGDGAISVGLSATHAYASPGTFNVTAAVTDSGTPSQTASKSSPVTVTTNILSTSFTFSPSTIQVGRTVTFTATTSGGTSPYTDSWNFGDGSSSSGARTTHVFNNPGSFQVVLTTHDSSSPTNTATSIKSLTVNAVSSTLRVTLSFNPTSPSAGQTVNFAATVSGGTAPYGVGWDFGDGGIAVGPTITHTYSSAGTFNVTAAATDSSSPAQTAAVSMLIVVTTPVPLTVQFSFSPSQPTAGTVVSFKSAVSGGIAPYDYSWNFGDSTATSSSANPSHTYSSAGTFKVSLTVNDSAGKQSTTSNNIVVATNSSSGGTSGQYCTSLTPTASGLEPILTVDYIDPISSTDYSTTALFDQGSRYSLAPLSLATSLGLNLTSGTPITLKGVGGTRVQGYVFHLTLEFGGTLRVVNVPVALTDSVDKFVIGKRGFLNQVSVSIDQTTETICFTASPSGQGCTTTQTVSGAHCNNGTTGPTSSTNNQGLGFLGVFTVSSGVISGLPMLFMLVPLTWLAIVSMRRAASPRVDARSRRPEKRRRIA